MSASDAKKTVFDLYSAIIPTKEVIQGGPAKDEIPALTRPKTIAGDQAEEMRAEDRVIGVVFDGEARAYPLHVLERHEVVNDQVGQRPITVVFCPLCDSASVFDPRTEDGIREFGVSGLLYNSNILMYDRGAKTESLWSQMKGQAVSGPQVRSPLVPLPLELTTWESWLKRHPETTVLSSDLPHGLNYRDSPYPPFLVRGPRLMFPVDRRDDRLPLKAEVLGIWSGEKAFALPLSELAKTSQVIDQRIAGKRINIQYDDAARSARVIDADEGVHWMYAYWFAWYAFHPETDIYFAAEDAAKPAVR